MLRETEFAMEKHIEGIESRRLINSEYQRGFMEGQQSAVKTVAGCLDAIMRKYDHVATAEDFIVDG